MQRSYALRVVHLPSLLASQCFLVQLVVMAAEGMHEECECLDFEKGVDAWSARKMVGLIELETEVGGAPREDKLFPFAISAEMRI